MPGENVGNKETILNFPNFLNILSPLLAHDVGKGLRCWNDDNSVPLGAKCTLLTSTEVCCTDVCSSIVTSAEKGTMISTMKSSIRGSLSKFLHASLTQLQVISLSGYVYPPI